ncbi:AHH domain-containing protein [Ochrobactrum sp. CM-21-5]|nr:AHH domain-containing protein [Ochrobactrum sp. CM-21-5]MBC2887735.1 AHH domain-containing protein [Ochrobactrum sp. CM-21-5]
MADKPAFQEHHIIERQAFKDSALLNQLVQQDLVHVNDAKNLLNMPADPALAAKIGVSPHNGGPLKPYSDALMEELGKLQDSPDGQAVLAGDKAAAGRIAERVNMMRDTMRAGLINGELLTNTPQGMTPELAKTKIADFMGNLEGYAKEHAGQIEKIAKTTPNRWDAITTAEDRVRAAVDAIEPNGIKASKGPAEIAKNNLGAAIVRSAEAGELTLSQGTLQNLGQVFSRAATGIAALGLVADIAVSTAEARQAALKGDIEGAHSIMNGLGARLAFGWLGAQWGASLGAGAGIYGTVIGGALGGIAGVLGGEELVRGIERVANQFAGLINPQGNAATPVKAPEAESSGGNTVITEFDPKSTRPTLVTTYNPLGKVTQQMRPQFDLQTGLKTREEISDADGKLQIVRSFAPGTGKLASETNYDRSTGKVSSEHTYDAQGAKTTKSFDRNDGHLTGTQEYNAAGKITRQVSYNANGKITLDNRRSYDAATGKQNGYQQYNGNGTLVYQGFYNPDGKETGHKSYDNSGTLTKDITINPDTKEILRDAVAEAKAKAKADAEWAAAQEAARIAAEKQAAADAAAKAEAERQAAQAGGHTGGGGGDPNETGWPGGKIPQPGSPTFEQERAQAGYGPGWIPDWRNPGQWMPDPFAPSDLDENYTCVGGPGTVIDGVPSNVPPVCVKTPFKRSAALNSKDYGTGGQFLPAASIREKRDPLSQQARLRKEWNEWQDPYFAKHPHKQPSAPIPVSPKRQAMRDALAQSIIIHQERIAKAAEIAPKSPWQRLAGMFGGGFTSDQDKRAFAEVSQLTAKTPEQLNEAARLLTGVPMDSSLMRI